MDMLRNAKIFISGGAGVIGTALVDKLLLQGARLFVGDLKIRPKSWPSEVLYREGDLNTISREELLEFEPEYFFHLAATFERTEETYPFWEENYHHNIRLSHYLLNHVVSCPSLKRIVFASSYLVYDPQQYLFDTPQMHPAILKEANAVNPRNLCGMAKFFHENELAFVQNYNRGRLSAISARIFRGYGRGSRDIISRWIRSLLRGETISVFGKENVFDFIYAEDTAEGLMRLGVSASSGTVNLGSGRSHSISEAVEVLKTNIPGMRISEGESPMVYECSQADMEAFQSIARWKPQFTLKEAIPLLIQYERIQLGL